MTQDTLLSAFVTLLVTVDPIGLAPIFLATVRNCEPREQREIAVRAGVIAFLILAFFTLAGANLLAALDIGIPALRIAGGLLLFWIAFEMVFETRPERKQRSADAVQREPGGGRHLAVFPIAIPLIAGPGAITAVILIAGRADGSLASRATLVALDATVTIACVGAFLMASLVARTLGETGAAVLSRVLGVILAALAAQFVIDGVKSAF